MPKQAEKVRGEERIQKLMEEFPVIPRTLVVKTDLIREGMKPSAGTRLAGRWALPDAHDYFEYDKEDLHTAEETTQGYITSPRAFYFGDGVVNWTMLDSRSPYEVRYEERGRYRLYRDGDPIEEVFFPPRPQWYDRKTSSGKPMPSVIGLRAEAFLMVVPLPYCGYGKDTCKYCNINPSETTKKGLGLERLTGKREQDIYETYVAAAQEGEISNVRLSGGVMLDSSKEADTYARTVKVLKRAMKDVGREVPINLNPQAMEAEDQMKLKEAGAANWKFNMEVWDPRLWEIICPGKAKYVGRERWLERMLQVVQILGSSSTSFVCGVEMAPPYGFKTEDEAAESVLEGFKWMFEHRVSPGGSFWRPAPGTEFAGLPAPRTEYFLRLARAQYGLATQYNMARKPGKPPAVGTSIFMDLAYWGLRDAPVAKPSRDAGPSGEAC